MRDNGAFNVAGSALVLCARGSLPMLQAENNGMVLGRNHTLGAAYVRGDFALHSKDPREWANFSDTSTPPPHSACEPRESTAHDAQEQTLHSAGSRMSEWPTTR